MFIDSKQASGPPFLKLLHSQAQNIERNMLQNIEALARVSSSLKKEQEAQTDPLASPVATVQRGVDTREVERGFAKVTIAIQTEGEMAGNEERGRTIVEAGTGDIKGARDDIPGGWELIWIEDPGKYEKVLVPREGTEVKLYIEGSCP